MTTVVFSSSRKLLRSLWAMLTVQMAANTLAKAKIAETVLSVSIYGEGMGVRAWAWV